MSRVSVRLAKAIAPDEASNGSASCRRSESRAHQCASGAALGRRGNTEETLRIALGGGEHNGAPAPGKRAIAPDELQMGLIGKLGNSGGGGVFVMKRDGPEVERVARVLMGVDRCCWRAWLSCVLLEAEHLGRDVFRHAEKIIVARDRFGHGPGASRGLKYSAEIAAGLRRFGNRQCRFAHQTAHNALLSAISCGKGMSDRRVNKLQLPFC